MHFSQYAERVSVVIRGDSLKKTLSEYLVDRIRATANIEVLAEVTALHSNGSLEAITPTDLHGRQGKEVSIERHVRQLASLPRPETFDFTPPVDVLRFRGNVFFFFTERRVGIIRFYQ